MKFKILQKEPQKRKKTITKKKTPTCFMVDIAYLNLINLQHKLPDAFLLQGSYTVSKCELEIKKELAAIYNNIFI